MPCSLKFGFGRTVESEMELLFAVALEKMGRLPLLTLCFLVLGMSPFGAIKASQNKKAGSAEEETTQIENNTDSRAALPRALAMVDKLIGKCVKIHAGTDDSLDVYDEAQDYVLDANKYQTGWARRPLVGHIYGGSAMTPEYTALIYEMVKWFACRSIFVTPSD